MGERRRRRQLVILTVLLCAGLRCRDVPPPSPWRVQLYGSIANPKVDGERWRIFDDRDAPRWRVEPSPDGSVGLVLERLEDGATERLEAQVDPRGSFAIVRTATRAATGRFRARLELGDEVAWQGNLRFDPQPDQRPRIARARALWDDDRAGAESILDALSHDDDPMLRRAAYLSWGRLALTESASVAGAIWDRGSRDPLLVKQVPRVAAYLVSSRIFTLVSTGNFDAAEQAIDRARASFGLVLGEETSDLLFYRGRIALHRGQPAESLRRFRASLDRAWATGHDNTWSISAVLISGQLLRLGRYREALHFATAGAKRARRQHQRIVGVGDVLWTRLWGQAAGVFAEDHQVLVHEYEALLEDIVELRWKPDLAVTRATLAYLALRRRDLPTAERWMRPVFEVPNEELGLERWFIRLVRAEVLLERGDLEGARAELEAVRAGARAEVGRVGADEVVALRMLAEVDRRQGKSELARERLQTAWRGSLDAARQIDLVGARNNYLHLQRELPVALARVYIDDGDPLGALAVLEETLYERWAQLRAFDSLESHPEAWSKLEVARAAARTAESANCEAGDTAARVGCRKRKTDTRAAVRAAKMALFDALEVPRRTDHRAAVRRVQTELRDGHGVLISLDGDDQRLTLLVTRDRIDVAGAAGALDGLQAPLSKLEAVAVVGSLDMSAHLDAEGTPWAARLGISRWPSVVWQGREVRPASGAPAVLADPNGSSPKTRVASQRLAKSLGAQLFVGPDATRERLTALLRERRPLVVFSGHAEVLDYDHASTRIWLYDAKLELQDILQGHLGADVVVLNGCTTGGTARGYGVGLPEAFLLQGTRAVLATIEPVPDDASTRFVARFTAAEPTKDPAAAFRAAVAASVEAKDDVWRRYRLWAR